MHHTAITYTTTIGEPLTIYGYAIEGIPLITMSGTLREGLIDLSPREARRIAADLVEFARRAERMALEQARELYVSAFVAPLHAADRSQEPRKKVDHAIRNRRSRRPRRHYRAIMHIAGPKYHRYTAEHGKPTQY